MRFIQSPWLVTFAVVTMLALPSVVSFPDNPLSTLLKTGASGEGEAGTDAFDAASFSSPSLVVNTYGFEPSVRVDSTGVVFVAFARALPNPSWVYRSTDGGASWTKLATPPVNRVGAEPEIALAADDTLYYSDLYVGNIVLAWYTNNGQTLAGSHVVGEASTAIDRQWITIGAPSLSGVGHELWVNTNDVGRGMMQYYTPDAQLVPAIKPSPIVVGGSPSFPPVYDPVNKWVYTVYAATNGINVARSSGIQPQPSRFLIQQGGTLDNLFPSVATDKAGNVFATWSATANGETHIWFTWSSNQGQTWTTPQKITTSGTHVFPWMAANSAGRAVVAWLGSDVAGDPEAMPASAPWEVRFAQIDISSGALAQSQAKATGTMHVGGICLSGLSCDTGSGVDRDLGDYLQVAIGPDGMAHIAYADDFQTSSPRIYHVRQTSGTVN